MTVPPPDMAQGPSPGEQGRPSGPAQWVLQADAARRAGCSVSAIRKWRREGSVASRKVTTPAGLERVEVRLEDVLGRAGPREMTSPDARGAEGLASSVAGAVLVPVNDVQALLERVAVADQLARVLEARLRAIDAEVGRMREQFLSLRRQIEQERSRGPGSGVAAPDGAAEPLKAPPSTPATPDHGPRQPPDTVRDNDEPAAVRSAAPPAPATPPAPVRRPLPNARPAPPPDRAPGSEPPTFQSLGARPPETQRAPAYDVERLGDELRRWFGRLRAWQGQAEVSPAEAERWVADLIAYDAALVRACRVLHVPAPYRVGERIPASARKALTRALAAAGLDVRRSAPTPT